MIEKRFLLVLLILIPLNDIFSQELHLKNTTWKKENLEGEIKTFVEIREGKSLNNQQKYEFNENGDLIQREFSDGKKWTFKYDSKQNQIKFKEYIKNNKCISSKYVYEKKEDRLIVRQYQTREWLPDESGDGDYVFYKWIYFYDKKGSLKKTETYLDEDDLQEEATYAYSKEGLLTNKCNLYRSREVSKTFYKYDSKNRMVEMKFLASPESSLKHAEKIITFSYDDNDNIIEEKYDTYPGMTTYKTYTYKYRYDRKMNWKKCIKYDNGNLVEVLKRTYTYF